MDPETLALPSVHHQEGLEELLEVGGVGGFGLDGTGRLLITCLFLGGVLSSTWFLEGVLYFNFWGGDS